jgi:ribonucleoside-diphosphate reductase alpha chain
MNIFNEFIFKRTYAKFLENENRRENWDETVKRYIDYLFEDTYDDFKNKYKDRCYDYILNLKVMPSMRMLMTAGDAHRRENISGYNCCFLSIENMKAFSELMYILMNGTGCGYSVEKKYVEKLPNLPTEYKHINLEILIDDSKLGWAEAYNKHIELLYNGEVATFNYRNIRKKGTPLKTMGGYASGHEVLRDLIEFTSNLFIACKSRKLKPIECHSLCCKIASIIVVGGVRRSALISFSDLDDEEMAKAKSNDWFLNNVHYSLANNSAVYHKKPSLDEFIKEYHTIYKSYSGERGFYNLDAINKKIDNVERRRNINKDYTEFYTNPCCEIILRGNGEFCNLTEVILRKDDKENDIFKKIEIATILGTLQSRYTNFQFLNSQFKKNCEEERLLGVSLTGIFDNELTLNPTSEFLELLRDYAIEINKVISFELGINQSVSISCIKPSGSVSALCGTSSGLHPAYAKYYIRNVRVSKSDAICNILIKNNIPYETDFYSGDNYVFSFYMKSDSILTTKELKATDHLNLWMMYNKHFCEHKPSITINYTDEEFLDLGSMIYNNFDEITGIALLPKSNTTYKQMPFTEITEEEFNEGFKKQPISINWNIENDNKFNINMDSIQCMGSNCDLE